MTIKHDIERCIGRLNSAWDGIEGSEYVDERARASAARTAVAELMVDMAETLNDRAGTGELSRIDRENIRDHTHDAFLDAVSAADERAAERDAA